MCLDEGADWVSYLAGVSEQGGYSDVISPAKDAPLVAGDVLMLDTGVVYDGYFCDYNRNFAVTEISNRLSLAGIDCKRQRRLVKICSSRQYCETGVFCNERNSSRR